MEEKFTCPRREETGMNLDNSPFKMSGQNLDFWNPRDGSCTYCGSMNPDYFMKRLESGDAELTPTDKNYKAYLVNISGGKFKMTHRDDELPWEGWDSPNHNFVTVENSEHKFYYAHLSKEQKEKFIELLNEKKIKMSYPGYLYVMPFFIQEVKREA